MSPEAVSLGPSENRSPAPEASGHADNEPPTTNNHPSIHSSAAAESSVQQPESSISDRAVHSSTHPSIRSSAPYPEPSPDLIADVRKRLAELPRDVAQYLDEALRREPIEQVANFLWKAGHPVFMLSELYEYRRTLFPPNALLDPYTAGPPAVRPETIASIRPNSPSAPPGSSMQQPVPSIQDPASSIEQPVSLPSENLSAQPSTHPPSHSPAEHSSIQDPASSISDPALHSPAEHSSIQDPRSSILPVPPPANGPLTSDLRPPTSGATLLHDLRSVLSRYVVLPEMAAEALALWVVHTYAFTLRQVTTYIGVVSPEKRCGKTTLLELLGLLANRSLTAANISPSALFRVIEETQPTLLIDEADTFLQGRDELAGILNAGYRKNNSYVVRVADRKQVGRGVPAAPSTEFAQWTPDPSPSLNPQRSPRSEGTRGSTLNARGTEFARYSCWCPKVMAAIGHLPDTLADRCILITMQRKLPGEKCERMRQLNALDFRRRCAEFVHANSQRIATAQPDIPSNLNDRAADIWEPLFAIADLAGGEWPELARQAARKLSAGDDDLTLIGYFLKDLRNLMVLKNLDRMLSRDLVATLNPMHSRPWEDLRRGREINEWWLGWQLRQLGIRTKTMRAGDAMGKGYMLSDIEAAFRRYVPNAELHLAQPTASLKYEISNVKSSDDQAHLERLMQQLLATLKEP